jgi:hypothetical protein
MAHFLLRKPFIKKGLTVATNLLLLTLDVVVSVVTNMKSPQIFPTVFAVTVFAMTQAAAPVLAQSTDNWQRFDNPAPQAGNSQAAPQISSSQPDPTLARIRRLLRLLRHTTPTADTRMGTAVNTALRPRVNMVHRLKANTNMVRRRGIIRLRHPRSAFRTL